MTKRVASEERKTKETQISLWLNLDGSGKISVDTTLPFFDHMLGSLAKHAGFDLTLRAKGDTQVDDHHTVEDAGLVLGKAFKIALGDKKGIRRFGSAVVPMDEARVQSSLDLSGRPFLLDQLGLSGKVKTFDLELLGEFLRAFVVESGITLHLWEDAVMARQKKNAHHLAEAAFKSLALSLRQAVSLDPRMKGVPSTKGKL